MRNIIAGLAISLLAACGGGASAPVQQVAALPTPISNVVAFMGDSITHLWDLTQYDAGPTINFGISGQTTVQMLARFDAVIMAAPGVVVILGGFNDMFQFGVAGTTIDSIKAMAAQAHAAGIRVIICSMLPANDMLAPQGFGLSDIEAFNSQLLELAQQNGYLYADYYDVMLNADGSQNQALFVDGLHPNDAGYAAMWPVIAPLINEDLQ